MSLPTPSTTQPSALLDSPPDEVLEAIATAGDIYARLRESGRELRFEREPGTGRPQARMLDDAGRVLRTLSATEVIELATGDAAPNGAEEV